MIFGRTTTINTRDLDALKVERDDLRDDWYDAERRCRSKDATIKADEKRIAELAATVTSKQAEIDMLRCLNRNAKKVIDDKNKLIDGLDALAKKYEADLANLKADKSDLWYAAIGKARAALLDFGTKTPAAAEVATLKAQRNTALDGQAKSEGRAEGLRQELNRYKATGINWPFPTAVCRSWECRAEPCFNGPYNYHAGYKVTAEFFLPPSNN
jgi:chromosome segregation ATPase